MIDQDTIDITAFLSELPVPENIKRMREAGVQIDLPSPVLNHNDEKLYLRVGNSFFVSHMKITTFHEALFAHLNEELGKEWIDEQAILPKEQRHFIYESFNELDDYLHAGGINMKQENPDLRSASPNGYVQSLMSLAFDVYLLKSADVLDTKVFNRLKVEDQYQGARYEIAVASIFIRAGWTIEWVKEKKGVSIPEFIATSRDGKFKVAVEAKSKRRDGILHKNGVFDPKNASKGNMLYLYKEALGKETFGLPYIIFLDINSPHEVAKTDKTHWVKDIIALMDTVDPGHNSETVDRQNLIVSTNFAPHYEGRNIATAGQTTFVYSTKSEHMIPRVYLDEIVAASGKSQAVPMLFPAIINNSKS